VAASIAGDTQDMDSRLGLAAAISGTVPPYQVFLGRESLAAALGLELPVSLPALMAVLFHLQFQFSVEEDAHSLIPLGGWDHCHQTSSAATQMVQH